jgi:hypothetical protein
MQLRTVFVILALFTLGGCTDADYEHGLSYVGLNDSEPGAPIQREPAPVIATGLPDPVTSSPDPFCQSVAQQDATSNAFDPATQRRVFGRSYAQCVALFATR